MKNKVSILLCTLCVVGMMYGCRGEANRADSTDSSRSLEDVEVQPLVIDNTSYDPSGIFYGDITICRPTSEDVSYEGLMMIEMDGDEIHIVCTDAVDVTTDN